MLLIRLVMNNRQYGKTFKNSQELVECLDKNNVTDIKVIKKAPKVDATTLKA